MKYVIFKMKQLIMPVMFPEHVAHAQITIEGAVPISAGFFNVDSTGVKILDQRSISLDLSPDMERDEGILTAAIVNAPTSLFLDFDAEEAANGLLFPPQS